MRNNTISNREQKPIQFDLLPYVYASEARSVGRYGFPQLEATDAVPSGRVLPFHYITSCEDPSGIWFHCFEDDYQFERLWRNLYYYIPLLKKAAGFIGPDFSMYREDSQDSLVWNCRRNRCVVYALQKAQVNVIPTGGFAGEESWSWCYQSLPFESTIAVTTNGVLSDPEARRLFVGGIDELVRQKNPRRLVICGRCPRWIGLKYPEIEIVHIKSYSEQWHERRCA